MGNRNMDEKKGDAQKKESSSECSKCGDEDGSTRESNSPEVQTENDKLLENKRTSVIDGKLMIPADKLQIPDELCRIKYVGKANKKHFVCEICVKIFNRADKIKYHLYQEHGEDFIRCCDSVPKILKKSLVAGDVESKATSPTQPAKEKKVSALGRIFKKKEAPKPLSVLATRGVKTKLGVNGKKIEEEANKSEKQDEHSQIKESTRRQTRKNKCDESDESLSLERPAKISPRRQIKKSIIENRSDKQL